jgi:hypothetical protein
MEHITGDDTEHTNSGTLDATKIKKLIDELDDADILTLHRVFIEYGVYTNNLDISDIGEDTTRIHGAVKFGLQLVSPEKLLEILPEGIRERLDESSAPNQPSQDEEKASLISELLKINSERDDKRKVPAAMRERFVEIIAKLTKVHNLPVVEIAKMISMDRHNITRLVNKFVESHPDIKLPDDKAQKGSEVHTQKTLSKAINDQADELVENDLALGKYIREKYFISAYTEGLTLFQLTDSSIPFYLSQKSIYSAFMDLKRENANLKLQNRNLANQNKELTSALEII